MAIVNFTPRCPVCLDTRLWITPQNEYAVCNRFESGDPHGPLTMAAVMLTKTVNRLADVKQQPNQHLFNIAKELTKADAGDPAVRDELIARFFHHLNDREKQIRALHDAIESLRKNWKLPIGARKGHPSGYWIITNEKDFRNWVKEYSRAPITQLTTVHRIAKLHWPIFAEQMELDFFENLAPTELEAAA